MASASKEWVCRGCEGREERERETEWRSHFAEWRCMRRIRKSLLAFLQQRSTFVSVASDAGNIRHSTKEPKWASTTTKLHVDLFISSACCFYFFLTLRLDWESQGNRATRWNALKAGEKYTNRAYTYTGESARPLRSDRRWKMHPLEVSRRHSLAVALNKREVRFNNI